MERQRIMIVVLVAAIALGGVASYSIYSYLQSQQQEVTRAKAEMGAVVVAADAIPFGSRIEERHLKKVLWPKANIPLGTFADPAPLIGRTVVGGIVAGEPMMEAKLAPAEAKAGIMAYVIPDGQRAMAVAVNEVVGVAGFVLPNSNVDVVVTTTPPGGRATSKIVLQNLKVLAIGQKMEEKEGKPVLVPTVTVSIKPEDAEKLALASNSGSLQLLLRGSKDTSPTSTTGASLGGLLDDKNSPTITAKAGEKGRVVRHAEKARAVRVTKKESAATEVAKADINEKVTIDVIKASRTEVKRSQETLTMNDGIWHKEEVKK